MGIPICEDSCMSHGFHGALIFIGSYVYFIAVFVHVSVGVLWVRVGGAMGVFKPPGLSVFKPPGLSVFKPPTNKKSPPWKR